MTLSMDPAAAEQLLDARAPAYVVPPYLPGPHRTKGSATFASVPRHTATFSASNTGPAERGRTGWCSRPGP